MADKKFLDAMTKKFKEAPEEKTTTFYNMGGWTQSERKTEFVNEGKAIADKRGIPMYNPDIGNPLGQRALMSYQLSGTDTFVEGDDLHFINNAAIQQAWDDIRKTVIVGLNTAHNVLEKRLGMEVTPETITNYLEVVNHAMPGAAVVQEHMVETNPLLVDDSYVKVFTGDDELADEIEILSEKLTDDDPKFDRMYEIICEKQKEENNRVIIFSSFRNTLAYIRKKLERRGVRVGQIDGSVPDAERYALRQRFLVSRDTEDAIDVLLFSEVGCEGLDYQFCDTMINYDLPWNPMRIEQRIGRIDRRGQKSDTVRIYNMITEDTIDETIYDRCLSKIGVFESSIGDCSEILGDISEQILKIMFDPRLTEEERNAKIEQMADNEVMKVQEMQRLEQDE